MELFDAGNLDSDIVKVFILSDLHIGCKNFAGEQFIADREAIKNDKYAKVVLPGDILQYDIKDSVGDTYGQAISPGEQKYEAERLLEPIKDKIIGICSGNHENRSKEDSNPIKDLCKFLGVHYFEDECSFRIGVGKDKYGNPAVFSFYGIHGSSNGQTIGAIGNSLQRLSGIVDADIYFQGHSHQPLHFSNVFFRRDMNHSRMIPVVRHYVSAGSYQGREKFPIVKGMIGKVMGCPVVTLTNKKEVTVSLPTGIKA